MEDIVDRELFGSPPTYRIQRENLGYRHFPNARGGCRPFEIRVD